MLGNLRLDRETERGEAKACAVAQVRAGAIMKTDVRCIAVVRWQRPRVIQLLPDGFGSEAGDDDFVRGKVLGGAGHDEQYVCAMRVGRPATGYLDLDTFCTLAHAIVSLGSGAFHGVSDEALARIGRARRVCLSVPSFLMLLEVLRSSSVGAQVAFERFAQVSQGSLKDRVAIFVRQFVEVCMYNRAGCSCASITCCVRAMRMPSSAWASTGKAASELNGARALSIR